MTRDRKKVDSGEPFRCIVTGGGTAGHVYPALALAEGILDRLPDTKFLFVGAKGGAEERIVPTHGHDLRVFEVRGLVTGINPFQVLRVLWMLVWAILRASRLLAQFKPHAVIGTGGYASAPVLLAAFLLRPLRLWNGTIALHEQNILPGRFNRWFARRADFVGASFPDTLPFLPAGKAYFTGYPVRRHLTDADTTRENPAETRQRLDIAPEAKVLLVIGGSSGARTINRVLLEALPRLLEDKAVHILHATGYGQGQYDPARETETALAAMKLGEEALRRYRWQPYFDDMASCYRVADLVVSRAGAGSVWELIAMGLPTILIPKANLPGDHQVKNARFMEKQGLARILYEHRASDPSSGTAGEGITPRAFLGAVSSLLSGPAPRSQPGNSRSDASHAGDRAQRFFQILEMCRGNRVEGDPDAWTLTGLRREGTGRPEPAIGVEWMTGAELLLMLERKRKRKEQLPEEDRRYVAYRANHLLFASLWQSRNLGVKLAGLADCRELLPVLLEYITDRTPAPWGHRVLGGDFRQVGFIRRNALQAVWRMEQYTPEVKQAIFAALKDPYFEVRSWAARAVSKLARHIADEQELEEMLVQNLRDPWFEVVAFSLEAIGHISKNPGILRTLVPLLEHKKWKIQEATVQALMNLLERDIIELSQRQKKRMRRIPMKGLDFSPQFPLDNTWKAFQRLMEEKSGVSDSSNHTKWIQ